MSAIVVSRKDGKLISGSIPEDVKRELAFQIFRAFCQAHPDQISGALAQGEESQARQ